MHSNGHLATIRFLIVCSLFAMPALAGCGGENPTEPSSADAGDVSTDTHVDNDTSETGVSAPSIVEFGAEPTDIIAGQSSTLTWSIEGSYNSLTIEPEIGDVTNSSSTQINPEETTTYTLTATNDAGTDTASTEVVVTSNSAPVIEGLENHVLFQNRNSMTGSITAEFQVSDESRSDQNVEDLTIEATSDNQNRLADSDLEPSCDSQGQCELTFSLSRQDAVEIEISVRVTDTLGATTTDNFVAEVRPRLVTNEQTSAAESLRQHVDRAAPGAYIGFDLTGSSSFPLASQIVLDKDVVIQGPGTEELTITGNDDSRLFKVAPDTSVEISGVRLTNGLVNGGLPGGGAIVNEGDLTLLDCTLANNETTMLDDPFGVEGGGAISNQPDASLTVRRCTFSSNSTRYGGAIINKAAYDSNNEVIASPTAEIYQSTFVDNSSRDNAGAIGIEAGEAKIVNSTFANNQAGGDFGSAIMIGDAGTLEMLQCTVANNSFDAQDSSQNGAVAAVESNFVGGHNILVDNQGSDLYGLLATVTWEGYNIIQNESLTAGDTNGNASTNISVNSGSLGVLTDNGGETETMLPQSSSPAIDAIPTSECVNLMGASITVDQRGETRPAPSGGNCDIGAVEVQ